MSGAKFSSVSIATVNSMAIAPLRMSFHEANGMDIAVSDLASRLQFASRSIFKAKLCKGGNSL
jgi:hypothetical protein